MTSETSRTQEDVTVASRGTASAFPNLLFSRYHGDLRVQIFLDQARRGRPTHFLRGATLDPPLTVVVVESSLVLPSIRNATHIGAGTSFVREFVCLFYYWRIFQQTLKPDRGISWKKKKTVSGVQGKRYVINNNKKKKEKMKWRKEFGRMISASKHKRYLKDKEVKRSAAVEYLESC